MRKLAMTLTASAVVLLSGAPMWKAEAQLLRGADKLCEAVKNYSPIEKAACGPYWGNHCGPYTHWVCSYGRCWCAPC